MGKEKRVEAFSADDPAASGFQYLVVATTDRFGAVSFHSYILHSDPRGPRWTKLNGAVAGPAELTELRVGDCFIEGERTAAMVLLSPFGDDEE